MVTNLNEKWNSTKFNIDQKNVWHIKLTQCLGTNNSKHIPFNTTIK